MKPIKLNVQAFGPYAGRQIFDFASLGERSFFLIHGPTGAGKTSILDAMCFALYGEASGGPGGKGGGREPRQLRSDHADAEVLTEVEFEFSIGARQYRLCRRPEQQRPKKRGSGMMVEKPEATLDRLAQGDEPQQRLASGWREVGERIERLMGFKAEQFRQVVMLPQGLFQRLLLADSQERQSILEVLFSAQMYGQIEEELRNTAARLSKEAEGRRLAQQETLRAAQALGVEQLRAAQGEAEAQMARMAGELDALRTAERQAQTRLEEGRRIDEKLKERQAAQQELRSWETRREEFAARQEAHQRACKASALAEVEKSAGQRQREAKEAAERQSRAELARVKAAASQAAAGTALEQEMAREPLREQARQSAAALQELAGKVALLGKAQAEVPPAREAHAKAKQARDLAGKRLDDSRKLQAAAEKRRGELEKEYAQLPGHQLKLQNAQAALQRRLALDSSQKELDSAEKAITRAKANLETARKQAERAGEESQRLQMLWNEGQAAVLAATLAEGEPCPVCGSKHHPAPAASSHAVPSQQDVERARAELRDAEKLRDSLREDVAERETVLASQRMLVQQHREALGMQIGVGVEQLRAQVAALGERIAQAESAGIEVEKARQAVEQLQKQEAEATRQVQGAEAELAEAAGRLSAAEAVVAERAAAVPEELRPPQALQRAIAAADANLKKLAETLEAARQKAEGAGREAARAEAEAQAAREQGEAAARLAGEARRELEERVAAAGFSRGIEEFRAAQLPAARIDELDQSIREYHISLQAAHKRLEAALAASEGLQAPNMPALQEEEMRARRAVEENIRLSTQLRQQMAQVQSCLQRLGQLEQELKELDEQYRIIGRIAEVARGDNAYRMTFQRYVLGVFLDEVLLAASQRLRIMSRGRFNLQRQTDPATGRRRAGGLDLEVEDTFTSTARPVSTLSGGECFLASLSLALGLADVVQRYAGGIRLETIFVDEGFGSLDPESLDLAIRALRDLQQGGRLVGIISHVGELKEWIDTRLEITPGHNGSTARFHVG